MNANFIAIIIVIIVLVLYIRHKVKENEKENVKRIRENEEKQLKAKYPDGYDYFKTYGDQRSYGRSTPSTFLFNRRSTEEILLLKNEIIKKQEKIDNYRKEAANKATDLENNQSKYNAESLALAKEYMSGFGRYRYFIPWEKINERGGRTKLNLTVWQYFVDSVCLDQDLDYSHIRIVKENYDNLPEFKNKFRYWNDSVYVKINCFLEQLAKQHQLSLFFNDYITGWDSNALSFHYEKISRNILNTQVINPINPNFQIGKKNYISSSIPSDIDIKYLVIIDCYTENSELVETCKCLFNQFDPPCVIYISLLKCLDRTEMLKWIDDKNKELKAEDEERREKESLMSKVSDWDNQIFKLRYKYLLKYYPTTCKFEANEDEWADRWTVWNFKNEPGVISPENHRQALNEIIPRIKEILIKTFGNSSLKYLTFVCVPASSQEKTEARYKEFSAQLCSETNMENAYDHIKVMNKSISKHEGGGRFKKGDIHFDEDFFKDKYILLFDDVITTGVTICKFKMEMEKLGTKVVCGLSIGKTKHMRDA